MQFHLSIFFLQYGKYLSSNRCMLCSSYVVLGGLQYIPVDIVSLVLYSLQKRGDILLVGSTRSKL